MTTAAQHEFIGSAKPLTIGFLAVMFAPLVSAFAWIAADESTFDGTKPLNTPFLVMGVLLAIAGTISLAVGIFRFADHADAVAYRRLG